MYMNSANFPIIEHIYMNNTCNNNVDLIIETYFLMKINVYVYDIDIIID